MNQVTVALLATLAVAASHVARGQTPGQASGQTPSQTIVGTIERVTAEGQQALIPLPLSKDRNLPGVGEGDRVFRTQFRAGRSGLQIAFVERTDGGVLFLDRNLDGRLSADEGAPYRPGNPFTQGPDVRFDLQVGPPGTPPLPFRCRVIGQGGQGGQYAFEFTGAFRVEGHAAIGGRKTLVSLPFDGSSGSASVRGRIGVDANGDGTIDLSVFSSAEVVWADSGKPPLFKVAGQVVSVASVDAAARTFVLRQHPPEAYKYVELRVGDAVPAFAFTDFEGRARQLADFRGKYVPLDFWGTWCGPCLAEFPTLRTARERFADRGFEILGIDYEKGGTLEHARAVVKERGVTWPNAAPDSVKELVEDVLRITAFPSKILVGPDGRVAAFLGFDVVGGELLRRLDALIR